MKLNVQIIIITVFVLFGVVGFILFSRSSGGGNSGSQTVVVWGTLPQIVMVPFAEKVTTKEYIVQYVEKNSETFERDLLEALAAGTGPDLFFINQENALLYRKFVYQIPYQSYSRRTYQNTFIDEANLFLTNDGIIALPLIIDPLVMYYNRSMLSSAFITNPPQFWDELVTVVPKLTRRTESGAIAQSALAFGTFDNINHAKEILSTLMLQAGSSLIGTNVNGKLQSLLSVQTSVVSNPADSALRFYSSFANSGMENYTWNSSLPNSSQMFTNGDLALYIGFSSELPGIRQRNTNLNFDITLIPQTRNSPIRATYGRITGLAVSKGSKNISGAIVTAGNMTKAQNVTEISIQLGLPPVRRDLLSLRSNDESYLSVFYNSAIIAQGFMDPDMNKTRLIFKRMVDNVNAGITESFQAVQRANSDINSLLSPYNE